MKIAVMGAGGIGGCCGGLLARAGSDVTLIARGAHLAAIQKDGLRVIQRDDDFTVKVKATNDPSQIGPVDLVLFSVKTYQNAEAIPLIQPLLGENSVVLTLQNGVESAGEVGQAHGPEKVLPGSAYLLCNIESPGVVRMHSPQARIAFGESNGELSQRSQAVHKILSEAAINTELSEDVIRVLWSKTLYNSPANGLASTARLAPKDLYESHGGKELFRSAIQEVANVACAYGVDFGEDDVRGAMELIANRPMGARGSMQADLEFGRRMELEAIVGAIGRIGRTVGVPTPIFDILYTLLLPYKNGSPENH